MPDHKRCCVPNCPNVKSYYRSPNAPLNAPQRLLSQSTFRIFQFPFKLHPQRARKWAEAIGKPEMEIISTTFICSDHFRETDYTSEEKRVLGSWAIPSLCLSSEEEVGVPVAELNEELKVSEGHDGQKKEQPCLICSSDTHQISEFRSPIRFSGDSSSKLLDDQLWSTFILRDVLKLPTVDYESLLERVGGSVHPSNWFVVCQNCETTLKQILNVHESLRKLERKLESLSGTLQNKLQESLVKEHWELNDDDKQEDKTILNVRQELRKFLRVITPSLPPIKQEPVDEENKTSDFDETWSPPPSPTRPPEPDPVKQENPLPSPSSSVKRRQLIKRSNQVKTKRARPLTTQTPTPSKPRPRRIRPGRKRKYSPVMCDHCGHNFTSQYDLDRHMVKHKIYDNSIDPTISTTHFICNLCPSPSSELFPSRRLLSAHKRGKHAEQLNLNLFKCSDCPETFLWKTAVAEHVIRKHPLSFSQYAHYVNHKIYKCDKCDYQTVFRCHLRRHSLTHENEPLICQYCSSSLKNYITLRRHVKLHHPEQMQGQGVNRLSNFGAGGTLAPRRSSGGDKRFPCKNCDATFPSKLELKLHLESTHKDLFSYQCDMCDKSYLSGHSLQLHKKIKHLESGKKAKCGWCGKVVNHRTYLWMHMKYCQKKPEATEGSGPAVNAVEVD